MDNQTKQLLISGVLGDGYLRPDGSMFFSCLHKEYMDFKHSLSQIKTSEVKEKPNNGFKKGATIFKTQIGSSEYGKLLYKLPLKDKVKELDELGLAMWLYDDGSLHKKNLFYNINTHSFTREDQENILIPLLNKFNIFPKIFTETKKDGRVFNYLYVSKYKGAIEISKVLSKYPLNCYNYKVLPQSFTNNFNKLSEAFKGFEISERTLSFLLKKDEKEFNHYLDNIIFINDFNQVSINKNTKYLKNNKVTL